MNSETRLFYDPIDGCDYFYDGKRKRYRRITDVESFLALPSSVRRQIAALKQDAQQCLALPTED